MAEFNQDAIAKPVFEEFPKEEKKAENEKKADDKKAEEKKPDDKEAKPAAEEGDAEGRA